MPRADRGVAQRYAAKKRKKRVAAARGSAEIPESAGSLEDPELEASRAVLSSLARPLPPPVVPAKRTVAVAQPRSVSRRTFASYADEYRYVVGDLRRVALVAGGLLLCLVLLAFVIR